MHNTKQSPGSNLEFEAMQFSEYCIEEIPSNSTSRYQAKPRESGSATDDSLCQFLDQVEWDGANGAIYQPLHSTNANVVNLNPSYMLQEEVLQCLVDQIILYPSKQISSADYTMELTNSIMDLVKKRMAEIKLLRHNTFPDTNAVSQSTQNIEILKYLSRELPRRVQGYLEMSSKDVDSNGARSTIAILVQQIQAALEAQMRIESRH